MDAGDCLGGDSGEDGMLGRCRYRGGLVLRRQGAQSQRIAETTIFAVDGSALLA